MADRNVTVRLSASADTSGITTFKNAMSDTGTKLNTMGDDLRNFKDRVAEVDQVLGTSFSSLTLSDVLEWAEDLNEAGMKMNLAERRFNNFFESMANAGGAQGYLQDLREATLGIVDDLTLMTTANRLMSMGLAESGEEVAQLMGMIVRIKDPMYTVEQAFESFGLMIANSSILRLDTFGINADVARQRIKELREELGIGRQEAFKIAALEGAQDTLARLGDSAEAAGTAFARMQTRVQNWILELSQGFASAVEGITGIAELMWGANPDQIAQEQAIKDQAIRNANTYGESWLYQTSLLMDQDQIPLIDPAVWVQGLVQMFEAVERDPSLLQSRDRLMATMTVLAEDVQGTLRGPMVDSFLKIYNEEYGRDLQQAAYQAYQTERMLARQKAIITEADAFEMAGDAYSEGLVALNEKIGARLTEIQDTLREGIDFGIAPGFEDAQVAFEQFMDTYRFIGEFEVPEFLRPETAEELARQYEDAAAQLEVMKKQAEEGLITDEQLDSAEAMVENLEGMAEAADEAAKRFADLKLSDIFGQEQGGMIGEMKDMVVDLLGDSLTDTAKSALEQAFDLESGEQTAASVAFKNKILPQLVAAAKDPEIAAEMAAALNETFQQAMLLGVDTTNTDFITALSDAMATTDFAAEGDQFDAGAFLDDYVTKTGEVSTNADLMADHLGRSIENITAMKDQAAEMADSFTPAQMASDKLASALRTMAEKPVRILVNLDLVDPGGLLRLLGGAGAVNAAVAEATRAEGGSAPGVKNR